jgi:FolB domain-containing protein
MDQGADQIHIDQLEIFVRVGVTENERLRPQRITLTLTIWLKDVFENLQDDINRTVNYSEVCRAAREFIQDRSHQLIETLASQLASHLLGTFPIRAVEVELRKFVLPDAKHVAVIVRRNAHHD